jgi:opacity protein-like surface antigen
MGVTSDQNFSGLILGGQVGANLQYRNAVFGIEVDGDWSNQQGTSPTFSLNVPWITTARLRIGAAHDNFQYYLTGGAGYLRLTGTALPGTAFNSTPRVWIAGVGQESAVNQSVLLRFEVLYMQPLSNTVTLPSITAGAPTGGRMYELMGRVGLSYKFAFPGI